MERLTLKEDRLRRRVAKLLGLKPTAAPQAIAAELQRRVAYRNANRVPQLSAELAEVSEGKPLDLAGLAQQLARAVPRHQVAGAVATDPQRERVPLPEPLQALRAARGRT